MPLLRPPYPAACCLRAKPDRMEIKRDSLHAAIVCMQPAFACMPKVRALKSYEMEFQMQDRLQHVYHAWLHSLMCTM